MKMEIKQKRMKERKDWIHYDAKGQEIFLCKTCLTLSSRPRVVFDENGVCNACLHAKAKRKTINWKARTAELKRLCKRFKRKDGYFDILVPCSGGKDGSYVAWVMKHKFGMRPLCVTFAPQMRTEIGRKNLENFIKSGFDHILINPNPEVYQKMAQVSFKEQGRPKMPFEFGVFCTVPQIAINFGIPFIMYGEEGETEYGGIRSLEKKPEVTREEMLYTYLEGYEPEEIWAGKNGLTKEDIALWRLPSEKEIKKAGLFVAHWSYFEDWDPLAHAKLSKEKCGWQGRTKASIGTYTNYAQLDDKLQDLHAFMMQIKFGFGRAWSDACIDIRKKAITREQGIKYVKKYDGIFPDMYLKDYLNYFNMTKQEFRKTIDSFRSPDIWRIEKGKWKLKFEIK